MPQPLGQASSGSVSTLQMQQARQGRGSAVGAMTIWQSVEVQTYRISQEAPATQRGPHPPPPQARAKAEHAEHAGGLAQRCK